MKNLNQRQDRRNTPNVPRPVRAIGINPNNLIAHITLMFDPRADQPKTQENYREHQFVLGVSLVAALRSFRRFNPLDIYDMLYPPPLHLGADASAPELAEYEGEMARYKQQVKRYAPDEATALKTIGVFVHPSVVMCESLPGPNDNRFILNPPNRWENIYDFDLLQELCEHPVQAFEHAALDLLDRMQDEDYAALVQVLERLYAQVHSSNADPTEAAVIATNGYHSETTEVVAA